VRPVGRRTLAVGAAATAGVVIVQSAALAAFYPAAHLDADLLSYLVYYRQLAEGLSTPFGYTVPKVLPVLLLGPLGTPEMALLASILVAAMGGALAFAIVARTFGATSAVLAAVLYVADPLRSVLTLRSSVDLYVGVALLGAIFAIGEGRALAAGLLVLVASLGKPVAAPCGLAILLTPGTSWTRRSLAALLPVAALPAAGVLAGILAGRDPLASAFAMPDQHERFVQVAEGVARGAGASLELIAVDWLGGSLFQRTWPLVAVGALVCALSAMRWRAPEARRGAALLLVPLLLVAGYLTVAAREPLVVFTRFFWPAAVVAAMLGAFGAVTLAARAPVPRWARAGLLATFALALLIDRWDDHRWRERIMLAPFETHAALAAGAVAAIAGSRDCAGPAIVPLAYLPLAAWRAPDKLARGELCAVEDWADGRGCAEPNCVLFIPAAPTTARARQALTSLVERPVVVEIQDEHGALVRPVHG
jgi:hypothetical protein